MHPLVGLTILMRMTSALAEFVMPDGRVVADPNTYLYNEKPNDSIVQREYLLLETSPNSALICPKNFTIGKVEQHLVLNSSVPLPTTQESRVLSLHRKADGSAGRESICPVLSNCLGHQACFFKFSNELCGRDVAPNLRKLLHLIVTCVADESMPRAEEDHRNETLLMTYSSRLDEGMQEYSATVVKKTRIKEEEVFEARCPPPEEAITDGFRGKCGQFEERHDEELQQMWTFLGRASSSRCRKELKQVFCSFLYQNEGLCVPPMFIEKAKGKWKYNFRSLPRAGFRPSVSLHRQIFHFKHRALIPARLGFLLMLHKDIPAAMDLLQMIYRPSHWYVIHVDSRSSAAREELNQMIAEVFPECENIVVLPEERSFATSWASYEIVRAELEGFEELLRLGLWDFVVNLSGADLPLRDVDDLAASLAAHRGSTFLPFVHLKNPNQTEDRFLSQEAFYACEGYVFNVTAAKRFPSPSELQMYNSPQWGVFARSFVAYLVDQEARSPALNKFQFYLQTSVVPDESYLTTFLMNSPFRRTVKVSPVHVLKEFSTVNVNNLCRHLTEADFCGQGPAVFLVHDLPELFTSAHSSFFARKFHTHHHDHTRSLVKSLAQGAYYQLLKRHLPQGIVKILAQRALLVLEEEEESLRGRRLHLSDVHRLRLVPSLSAHDPCCQSALSSPLRKISDHKLWIDFSFFDTTTRKTEDARSLLIPSLNGRFCYSDGHLKMALISPWKREVPDASNNDTGNKPVLHESLPLPYGPAYTSQVSVLLVFSTESATSACSGEGEVGIPLTFPEPESHRSTVHVLIQLMSPSKAIRCMRHRFISWSTDSIGNSTPNSQKQTFSSPMIHHFVLDCGSLEPGPWRILMSQANTSDARIYNFPFYLLDYSKKDIVASAAAQIKDDCTTPQCSHPQRASQRYYDVMLRELKAETLHPQDRELDAIQHLWQVDEAVLLPLPDFYISENEKPLFRHQSEPAAKDTWRNDDADAFRPKKFVAEYYSPQQRPHRSRQTVLVQWLSCSGGFITSVSASVLFYHWLLWHRSVRQQCSSFLCLLLLGLATTLQMMLAVHC